MTTLLEQLFEHFEPGGSADWYCRYCGAQASESSANNHETVHRASGERTQIATECVVTLRCAECGTEETQGM